MAKKKSPYELDFEEYIRNSEPAKKEKTYAWTTAIGLQHAARTAEAVLSRCGRAPAAV